MPSGTLALVANKNKSNPGGSISVYFTPGERRVLAAAAVSTQTKQYSELAVPIGNGLAVKVPFPMSKDDFEMLIGSLHLWKKKLIEPDGANKPSE